MLLISALTLTAIAIVLLVRHHTTRAIVCECDADWLSNFSMARYRPMLRLLDDADLKFLASQPGYSKKIIKRLRVERRAIFRAYLRNLVQDFQKLHMAARAALVDAPQDRSDLAMILLRQRLTFTVAIVAVECRLLQHALGFGRVNVSNLLPTFDRIRENIIDAAAA